MYLWFPCLSRFCRIRLDKADDKVDELADFNGSTSSDIGFKNSFEDSLLDSEFKVSNSYLSQFCTQLFNIIVKYIAFF